jgi:hypothetical protein
VENAELGDEAVRQRILVVLGATQHAWVDLWAMSSRSHLGLFVLESLARRSDLRTLTLQTDSAIGMTPDTLVARVRDIVSHNPQLELADLMLDHSGLCAGDVHMLGQSLQGRRIARLDLSGNEIGRLGAAYLAEALPGMSVTNLALNDCRLGNAGLAHILPALPASLKSISLKGNGIVARSLPSVITSLQASNVTMVVLFQNEFSEEALDSAWPMDARVNAQGRPITVLA